MWMILEIFSDPSLLTRVRAELKTSFPNEHSILHMKFDSQTLDSLPLLKSIYAETLRLRIHIYAVRHTGDEALQINQWLLPKDRVVLVATAPAHMDETFWNTRDGVHPLDKFWADRFLVYPGDPRSGPKKPASIAHVEKVSPEATNTTTPVGVPQYSTEGTEGVWIPYGGGTRSCPGRFYSKHVMISACAMMVTLFDMEILADDAALKMNPLFYGFGGQYPVGKVPFRIRRRRT